MYSVNDINRIFASFSNYQFTVNHYQNQNNGGVYIEGDSQIFSPATLNWSSSATVTSAKYTDKEMDICFTLETLYSEKYEETTNTLQYNVSETIDKKAILEPDEMGKYRIVRIENHDSSAKDTKENQLSEVSELYENILNSVANGEAEYGFPEVVDNRSECQYFLYDMDGDDIPELIVGKESIVDTVIITKICHVYSCKKRILDIQ